MTAAQPDPEFQQLTQTAVRSDGLLDEALKRKSAASQRVANLKDQIGELQYELMQAESDYVDAASALVDLEQCLTSSNVYSLRIPADGNLRPRG